LFEEYEEERGQRGRGKSVSLPMSLKFDGKSNWKAFYAKFPRYAEVIIKLDLGCFGEFTETKPFF
jgi:hypothetical protein